MIKSNTLIFKKFCDRILLITYLRQSLTSIMIRISKILRVLLKLVEMRRMLSTPKIIKKKKKNYKIF